MDVPTKQLVEKDSTTGETPTGTARILYVDDERGAREAFAHAASELGFQVDTADGGGEALTMVSRRRYAVIASDLRMPTLNGLSLIQLLRPRCPDASYLIVTGASHLELPVQSNGLPLVDEVVAKPWSMESLGKTLTLAITRYQDRSLHAQAELVSERPLLMVQESAPVTEAVKDALASTALQASLVSAESLRQAEQQLEQRSFRAVLTGLKLPDAHGLEIVHRLRQLAPKLPIIVMDALDLDDDEVAARVLKAGAQDYLVTSRLDGYILRRSIRYACERKHAEERLAYLSHHDPVTGLGNRYLFRERLSHAIAQARRRDKSIGLLLMDLDRFKTVNDSLGHDLGDRLLKVVAERLTENVREVDTVARLGGDEFAVLLEDVESDEQSIAAAKRLLEALIPPAKLGDYEIAATGSVGIALFPDHAENESELLQYADKAMYRAKQNGRDGFALYSREGEETCSGVLERLSFESGVRHALERNEYVVFYQPQLSWDRTKLMAVEALIRWHHPEAGLIPPGKFIPFLESSGLIKGVGEWVLRTACRQIRRWQEWGLPELRISVNLSARQFEGSDLVGSVESILKESELSPASLELEITESLLMKDTQRTRAILDELKALGVRIAIDDFGTGYSSLAYLKKFPIDCLKIDRSFVHEITCDSDDRAIAEAIQSLGKSLRLDVVAEGVETEAQLELLKGCDGFQGFLISKPQPAEKLEQLLERYIET